MCDRCHEEDDRDYEGDSVEAQRRQAIRSVIERHDELGLDPNEVSFRFAPKAEETCVRVALDGQTPRYEIHVPGYTAQAMTSSPPLSGIAMAAWIETNRSYETIADILDIRATQQFGAFFVAETPPINTARVNNAPDVYEYEREIYEHRTSE